MFATLFLSFMISGDCQDAAKKLASVRTPFEELSQIIRFPKLTEGLVARLYEAEDLRLYGFPNINEAELSNSWIDRIEIWSVDEYPIKVGELIIDRNQKIDFKRYVSEGLFLRALQSHPRLEGFLVRYEFIPFFEAMEREELLQEAESEIDALLLKASEVEGDIDGRTWDFVYEKSYSQMYRQILLQERYLMRQLKYFKFNSLRDLPLSPQHGRIRFRGWLPPQQKAVVIIEMNPSSGGLGMDIYLNQRFQNFLDPVFPNIGARINLENRFDFSWLAFDPEHLIAIQPESLSAMNYSSETDRAMDSLESAPGWGQFVDARLLKSQILFFESRDDLPRGLPFQELDTLTLLPTSKMRTLAKKAK